MEPFLIKLPGLGPNFLPFIGCQGFKIILRLEVGLGFGHLRRQEFKAWLV